MGHLDDLKTILAEFRKLQGATAETVDLVGRLIRERDELRADLDRLKARPRGESQDVRSIATSGSPSPSSSFGVSIRSPEGPGTWLGELAVSREGRSLVIAYDCDDCHYSFEYPIRLGRLLSVLGLTAADCEGAIAEGIAQPYSGSEDVQSIVTSDSPSPSVSSDSTRQEPR